MRPWHCDCVGNDTPSVAAMVCREQLVGGANSFGMQTVRAFGSGATQCIPACVQARPCEYTCSDQAVMHAVTQQRPRRLTVQECNGRGRWCSTPCKLLRAAYWFGPQTGLEGPWVAPLFTAGILFYLATLNHRDGKRSLVRNLVTAYIAITGVVEVRLLA